MRTIYQATTSFDCRARASCSSMVPEVSCLHGSWVGGVCKCESGYMTEFRDVDLYPIYCSIKETAFVLNLRKGYEPLDFLHYFTMSVTVALPTGSLLGLLLFLYTLLDAYLLSYKIKKSKVKLEQYRKNQIRRDPTENLNVDLWYPNLQEFRCINDPKFTPEKAASKEKKKKAVYAKVIFNYKPHGAGELRLHAGDTIKNVSRLNRGWCKGEVNGKIGFYPEAYTVKFSHTESDKEDGTVRKKKKSRTH